MVVKPVENFLVVCSNGVGDKLESYKILRYGDSPSITNRMIAFKGKVVDVNIRRNDGVLGFNLFFSKHTIIGGIDLDRVREVAFDEGKVLTVKDSPVSVKLALADDFDDLPRDFKEHPFFGESFRTGYLLMSQQVELRETFKQWGLDEKRVKDLLTDSKSQYFRQLGEVADAVRSDALAKGKAEVEKSQPSETLGGGF